MGDLRDQAKKLKEAKKFSEAVQIYEQVWSKENKDKWIGWEYAYCLKQANEITKAIAICKHTYLLDKNLKINNDLMGWCVYEKYFKNKKESYSAHEIEQLESVGQAIINIIEQSPKSAYDHIIFSIINIYKKKGDKKSYGKILEWLNRLDVDLLSTDTFSYVDYKGNNSELQSRKEEYYSLRSKCLITIEEYEECIRCCEDAIEQLENFHYDNDVWIVARKYYAYGMLGEFDKAISGMKNLAIKKNHWSLLFNIAQIYNRAGQSDKAMLYSYKALLSRDPDKMKIKVIYFVAQKLHKLGETDLASLHYFYYMKIREENDWGTSVQVDNYIKNNPPTEINVSPGSMKKIWINKVKANSKIYTGRISKIMPSKKTGFINFDNNKSVFFRVSEIQGRCKVVENLNVSFILEDSYDSKKDKITQEAKYIEIL